MFVPALALQLRQLPLQCRKIHKIDIASQNIASRPKFRPDKEIKLTGKLDCRIIQIFFTLTLVQTLLSIFCDPKIFRHRFSSHWEKNLAGNWQHVANQSMVQKQVLMSLFHDETTEPFTNCSFMCVVSSLALYFP